MNINPIPFPPGTPADALHVHYSGQLEPQQVFAALDLRDGEWSIDYNAGKLVTLYPQTCGTGA